MGTYATACFASAYGVASGDGCSTANTLEGTFQKEIDSYSWTLQDARGRALNGQQPFGGGVSYPYQVRDDILGKAAWYCNAYPGACPADPAALAQQYVKILEDQCAQYGFDMQGNYSGALDNSPGTDALYPEGVAPTPIAVTPNIVSYSPSAGYRPPVDSVPVELSPTIPAYTSPSNVAATSPGSRTASGGGSSVASTASGAGASQGGSTTQQTTLAPTAAAAAGIASLSPGAQNSKLLIILLVIAVAIILFGRN